MMTIEERIEVVRVQLAAIATAAKVDAERAGELRAWAEDIDAMAEDAVRADLEGHLLDLRRILHRLRQEERP